MPTMLSVVPSAAEPVRGDAPSGGGSERDNAELRAAPTFNPGVGGAIKVILKPPRADNTSAPPQTGSSAVGHGARGDAEAAPTVVPAACRPGEVDQLLIRALQNPRDRSLMLKLDSELERFMKDESVLRLEFPAMTSYQRLIVHRVADYFLLHHLAVDREPGKRGVVLMKHAGSRIPAIRFQELVKKQEAREKKEVKILLRKKDSDESRPSVQKETGTTPSGDSTPKTLEEREEEFLREREEQYMKARARIFEEEGNGPNESTDVAPLQKVSTTVFDESPMADRAVYARADPSIYQRDRSGMVQPGYYVVPRGRGDMYRMGPAYGMPHQPQYVPPAMESGDARMKAQYYAAGSGGYMFSESQRGRGAVRGPGAARGMVHGHGEYMAGEFAGVMGWYQQGAVSYPERHQAHGRPYPVQPRNAAYVIPRKPQSQSVGAADARGAGGEVERRKSADESPPGRKHATGTAPRHVSAPSIPRGGVYMPYVSQWPPYASAPMQRAAGQHGVDHYGFGRGGPPTHQAGHSARYPVPEGEEIHHGHQQHLHHQQQQQQQQYHRTAGRQEEEGAIPAPHEAGVPQRRAEHFANGDTQ